MKEIIIDSDQRKRYCTTLISEMEADGSETIIFKKTDKNPTAKQRRLWRLWCREVSLSGLGQDDIAEDVHVRAKWQFVKPLMLIQSEMFVMIYNHFIKMVEFSPYKAEKCIEFSKDYISTESLTKGNRIKSLQDFQKYWVREGVNLTDPSLMGLDKLIKRIEGK